MNAVTGTVAHYREAFDAAAPELPGRGLDWLDATRDRALARFTELGFPGPRDEDWKYTKVAPIEKRAFKPAGKACIGLDADDLEHWFLGEAHRLVFVNGRYQRALSSPGELPAGVTLCSLAEAIEKYPERLREHFGHTPHAHGFTALNEAFTGDGAYLHLARGTALARPVHLLFAATAQEADTFTNPRVVIAADETSEARVVEHYVSFADAGYFSNALTEAVLAQGAHLHHYKLQEEATSAFHVATLSVQQARDSRFVSHSFSLGAKLARNDINSVLDGEGAECILNGLYIAGGRQHVDYHTRIDHAKPRCTSRETYKGILSGRGRGVFNGRVYVHPDAQKTDAEQSNKNLLLSRDAEVDTKPQLEIFADDVKCAHGATVGQLDETMVFYLRSRGIDEAAARGLLTYGFARDVVDQVDLEGLRGRLEALLLERLPNAGRVQEIVA